MGPSPESYPIVSKARLEALSDGLYAIALTLLVLELKLPALSDHPTNDELLSALTSIAPKAFAWCLSFWVIAQFWLIQQRLFHFVARLNPTMVAIELGSLCLISLFPFTTALMGEFGMRVVGAVPYAAHLLAIAVVLLLRFSYFIRHKELHAAAMSPDHERVMWVRAWVFAACSAATFFLAFFVPPYNTLAMLPILFLSRLARAKVLSVKAETTNGG